MAIVAADTAGRRADRIESLLSARLFVEPQLADDRLFFVSNLSGHLSLYAMDASGGVPEPLLPPQIALQNPELVGGHLFHVLPDLRQILVMIDADGDENYVPHLVPIEGGFPEPLAEETSPAVASHLVDVDDDTDTAFFSVESREESLETAIRVDLASRNAETFWQSMYGGVRGGLVARSLAHRARSTATRWATSCSTRSTTADARMLHGTPIEERDPESRVPAVRLRQSGTARRAARASC